MNFGGKIKLAACLFCPSLLMSAVAEDSCRGISRKCCVSHNSMLNIAHCWTGPGYWVDLPNVVWNCETKLTKGCSEDVCDAFIYNDWVPLIEEIGENDTYCDFHYSTSRQDAAVDVVCKYSVRVTCKSAFDYWRDWKIDLRDFAILQNQWGQSVLEPTTKP